MTFLKRQKEAQRRLKREEKQRRRLERKQQPKSSPVLETGVVVQIQTKVESKEQEQS
jgi:hypothetical protein